MAEQETDALHSYRCVCGRLLFKGFLLDSAIQIKCKRCGELMVFQGLKEEDLPETKFGMMFNRNGDVVSATSNIQKVLGYKISELLTKHYGDLLLSGTREVARSGFNHLWSLPYKERYFYRGKTTFLHKDGRGIAGTMRSKFVVKEDQELLFSTFSMKEPKDESETEFATLREYPFILHVSREGICTDASMTRKKPYSRPRSEIVGKPFVSFMKAGPARRQKVLDKLKADEAFQLIGETFERLDGVGVKMDVFFTPNFNKAGECVDYMVFVVNHELLGRHEEQFAPSTHL